MTTQYVQDLTRITLQPDVDAVLLLGPPGCGKTHILGRVIRALNHHLLGCACLCAHAAAIAVHIGGRSIAYHMNYGMWAPAPRNCYTDGKEAHVSGYQVVAVEEAQASSTHMWSDMALRLWTADQQVSNAHVE